MSTNLSTRLARIEAKLDEIAPARLGIARRLEAACKAHEQRIARGEPEPVWIPLDLDNPTLSWDSQELRRRLNDAHERMERYRGSADAARTALPAPSIAAMVTP